jgi:hypothetical protein
MKCKSRLDECSPEGFQVAAVEEELLVSHQKIVDTRFRQ